MCEGVTPRLGLQPSPMTPGEFDKFIDLEITRVVGFARNAGIKPR